ncbi:MAG: acyl-CoA synthetase (NDP forming) [Paracoccaceae bacterium]|jgi:acyl-CoA synthetase (NDP forming)
MTAPTPISETAMNDGTMATMPDTAPTGLDALFAPRSVAIVGASSDPTRIGGRPIDYYLKAGFKGAIHPVNPNRAEVQGLRAWPDLASIPGPVDCAVLAIPASAIPDALRACAAKGVKAVVIFSAGFSELGPAGVAAQVELADLARSHGMRVLGPNCLGMYNGVIGHCATFTSGLEGGMPRVGRIGLITQSGAYGTHLLSMAKTRRLGIAAWISTGNEVDVTAAECLEYMVDSPDIDAIGVYMEGINDPAALVRALRRARALRKPVSIMKVGVSAVGVQAVQSHTASLAGSDAGIQAVLDAHGAHRAKTTEEMFDVLYAAAVSPPASGDSLGILTVSGGAGVLMADAADTLGLRVTPMPPATVARLMVRNPLSSPRNPVDITAHALNDFGLVGENLTAMLTDGGYDLLAGFFTSWTASPVFGPKVRAALTEALSGNAKPFALVGQASPDQMDAYEADGIIVFEDPSRAVAALASLARFARAFDTPEDDPADLPDIGAIPVPARAIPEDEGKALLARAGIGVLTEEVAVTPALAAAAAVRLGLPVAMKIVSPDIAHKSEVGGVALGLNDAAAVEAAAHAMLATVAALAPNAAITGLLIAPMAGEGVELIVGAHRDPVLGMMALVGLGGIFAEVMKDTVTAPAPVTPARAEAMLRSLRGAALLDGVRGRPAVDIKAVADAVSRLSVLAARNEATLDGIEINPLLARPDGAVALDALFTPRAMTP